MAKKVFKKNKKARFFLISREFLAPQKKIFKYCLRYWKRRIKRKIKLIKLRFSKRSTALLAVLKDKIKKQAYILRGKNFYMSFRPFCVAQGIAVFVLTLCILFTAAWFVSPKPRISQSQIIKTALTKQTSPAVVGQTVKWSAVIKKSDITAGANLVQLPKNAQNIKVKSITKQEALAIANYSAETSQFQFAAEERKQLTKTEPKNFLSKVYRFFLADVHGAAENAVAQITESIAESQPEIIETNEAVFVDVSEALPAEEPEPEVQQPAESPADNQAGEEPEQPQEQIAEEEPAQSSEPARNDAAASGGDIELGEPAESPADNQAGEEPIEEEFVESESERQEEIDESEQEAISELPEIPVIEPVSLSNQEIIQLPGELLTETTTPTDQEVVEIEQSEETEEYVEVDYETPAPEITEQETDKGKLVTISAEEQPDQPPITNVLAYTTIPEIYKVGQESKIKIKWQNPDCEAVEDPRQAEACRDNGYAEMEFHAFDLNNNGKLDYVEWTVPHLSEQIFEIIFISKAFEMDENQQIVADIYDLTVAQDNQWATVPNGHYVRATFEQILDNTKDNTIYAKPTNPGQPATIEVYPIYEDQDGNQTQGGLVATFESIDHEGMYGILLTNLGTPTDIFDLKIISGDIDIDWIVDPSNIAYGAENAFASASTTYVSTAMLTSTSFVIAYRDSTGYGTAVVGSISGTTISYGTPVAFNSAATTYISVAALDSTHFVAAYSDVGNSDVGTAIVGEVSGTTISSYGAESVFNTVTNANSISISVAALDSTHFVVLCKSNVPPATNRGYAIVGVVSGTTITGYGTQSTFSTGVVTYVSVAALSSTSFVFGFFATYGRSRIGTVDGTTISYGTEKDMIALDVQAYISFTKLSATSFVVGYTDSNTYGTAAIGSVSGTTITYGAAYPFNSAATAYVSVSALDSTHFIAGYQDTGNSSYGTALAGTISGTDITYEDEAAFNSASTAYVSVAALDTTNFVAGYQDTGNSSYGTGIIGVYSGGAPANTAPNAPTLVSPANGSYTTDTTPTLSANYSDPDVGDVGTTNYRISSSSLADCVSNTNIVASGTSSETADENEDTTWTNGSSIGNDATYYWCAQNNDGVDTSSWTQMGNFILDTAVAVPTVTSVGGDTSAPYSISDTSPEILITLDEAGDCYASETDEAYDDMSGDTNCTGDTTTSITCQMGTLAESASKTIYVACQDTAGNKDTIATNEEITMEIDATPPTISGFNPAAGGVSSLPSSVSFTLNEAGYCRSSASDLSYSAMASADDCSGGGTTSITCSISGSSALSLSVNISCQDILENENTADNNTNLSYTLSSGGGGGGTFSWNPFAGQEQGSEAENILDNLDEAVDQIAQQITNQINNATEQISNLAEKAADFYKNTIINNFQEPEQVSFPPIEETVTPETPAALQNQWNLIQQKRFNEISILPLPDEIKQLALDFPSFQETLEKVGFTKPEDVEKIRVAKLSFPGLAETLGRVSAGINPSNFSIKDKIKMPTNFIFARVTEDKIDFKTKVSLASDNDVTKSITTLQNKPLYLIVKPDKPAKKVTGYIVFKSVSSESALKEFAAGLSPALSASLIDAFTLPQQPGQEIKATKELVLNKFEYQDSDKDGIYTATITSPAVAGKYEIKTIIDYISQDYSSAELNMIMVVDPEGYVYRKISDNDEARIKGAEVTIYWLNPETKQFEIWPAKDFQQENPQTTDNTGKYSFLVPEGFYYIEVKAEGYIPYKGDIFEVQEGSGVHTNIELKIANWWQRTFTIERVLLGLITILLLALLIVLSVIILKRKTQII
ncbi:MAG TPA: hypothetical protein DEP95_02840 [Candidatus Staskawiczbacteria bacterium]|nr:hypothetical protein [Candidatus Staskawiczbacteria bacterium]